MPAPDWTLVIVLLAGACGVVATARADEYSIPLIAYSEDIVTTPRYAMVSGYAWSAEASSPSVGREVKWIVARNCPDQNETAVVTLDYDSDINISRFDGTAWTANSELCTNTGGNSDRSFDACYEQSSGDLLVTYWNHTTKKVGYRTSTGGALSAEASLTLPSVVLVRYITVVPKPGADEVMLLAVNDSNNLFTSVWNGSAWGPVVTLASATQSDLNECYAAAYERISGHAVVAYAKSTLNTPAYRTWDGTAWSAELLAPNVGSTQLWIRLAPEPDSDRMVMVTQDSAKDVNVTTWSGSAWGAVQEVENNVQQTNRRQFDMAFAPAGGGAILAYAENGSNSLRYRTLSGSAWSAEQTGPNVGGKPQVIAMRQGEHTNEVWVAASTDGFDLAVCLWRGSTLGAANILETVLGGDAECEQFMIATPQGTQPPQPRVVRWTHTAP